MTADEEQFIEAMGRHFEADGIPRIGGRLFGFLLLREESCSLDDLVDHLRVSKTSISTNARLLEQWGLIERVSRPGDRRDYYQAAPDQARTLEIQLARVRDYGALLRRGNTAAANATASHRLAAMAEFNDEAIAALEPLLDRRPPTD